MTTSNADSDSKSLSMRSPRSNIAAATALFFTAPFVAEYLLGNLPIQAIGLMAVEAPLYGGAALLIREIVRWKNRGWPSIVLLGMAFAVVEEGFLTQSLFNPDYLHLHLHLLQAAYIPPLKIGGRWTLWTLNVHAVWSISTPIAIVESCWPGSTRSPWLRPFGICVASGLFALGCFLTASFTFRSDHFVSAPMSFVGVGAVCGVLILLALTLPPKRASVKPGSVPKEWQCGLIALALGSAALCTPNSWGWGAVAVLLICDLIAVGVVTNFSKHQAWTLGHKLSLAAGAAAAYGWHAFIQKPVFGSDDIARIGNAVFLVLTVGIIWLASNRLYPAPLPPEHVA